MADFIPGNSIEIQLRRIIQDKHTPVWDFFTPLAAAELYIITANHPELDGSDDVAPGGGNPEVCVFQGKDGSYIGTYTSASRVQEAFELWNLSTAEYTFVSAKGWQLLRYLNEFDASLWINAGLKECQYHLDPDLVSILLERPEPPDQPAPEPGIVIGGDQEPPRFLAPLRDFLAKQPEVRAAWVFAKPDSDAWEVGIVATDPEDDSIIEKVGTVVKAVTPVEVQCSVMMMMADDLSLENLSNAQEPFYKGPGFPKAALK